ncbi:hypothetical protein HZB60_02935 [candidate division KSB1 bacterium]|nr:hypothetical protein [candidate division KSB1 bacterium]
MSQVAEKLTQFVRQAGELFEFEDFEDLEIGETEVFDEETGIVSIDIVREDTDELFRFCVFDRELDLNAEIAELFDLYRELEFEVADEHSGSVLLCKGATADEFIWVYRNESEEIGIYHSEFSVDAEDDDDDDDEDEDGDEDEDEDTIDDGDEDDDEDDDTKETR